MEVLGINKNKSKHPRYFFLYKRDYSPNKPYLGVMFSEAPPPLPRTAIDFLPGRLQASEISKLAWIRLNCTPYIPFADLMSTKLMCVPKTMKFD